MDFSGFSYFFGEFSGCFVVIRGAVLWISAVSATFFQNFSSFWAGLGSCFRSFMDYSYPRPACYQLMAIVHYAMQIEQLSDIKALVMRLKSDTVPGSKTQSWLRLCRKIKDNPRFITAPFRETKAFEKLYNQRTSVERTFGDLKDNYNLDNIRVAKMARAKVFMDLSCIALIASRLSDAASKEKTTKIVQIYHSKNSYEKSAI